MAVQGDGGWWQNIETAVIALITGAVAVVGFIWGILWKVNTMGDAIEQQKREIVASKTEIDKLAQNVAKLHEEHFRLREMLAAQPTKQDLIGLETRLGTQLDRIVQRIDTSLAQ